MTNSIWKNNIEKPSFKELNENVECDVLVVGGGIAGILATHELSHRGIKTILLEGNEICSGITDKTTAVLSAQHDTPYSSLIKTHGQEAAKAYLRANLDAVEEYKKFAEHIDCDFEIQPSYMFSRKSDMKYESDALSSLGYNAQITTETGLPFDIKGAVMFPDMAVFHPLKFLYSLAKDLTIYEHSFVSEIKDHTAYIGQYKVKFNKAVIATHFPFINRAGWFFIKMYQVRSCVAAYENAADVKGTYIEDREGGLYFRNYGNMLIIGAGDHRTGTKSKGFDDIRDFCKKYYPTATEKYVWANQDCVTLDGLPYVGKYGCLEDVYAISGFNLWGMTNALASAKAIAELISGTENEYCRACRTDRSIMHKQLFANLGVTTLNLLLPVPKRCPHMGCSLWYNKKEHSWDCQCHGSRFAHNGSLLDNPAKKDL